MIFISIKKMGIIHGYYFERKWVVNNTHQLWVLLSTQRFLYPLRKWVLFCKKIDIIYGYYLGEFFSI